MEMNEFFKKVEDVYGKEARRALELKLERNGEEIIDAYPVRRSEHNWYPGIPDAERIAKDLLNGHFLTLKDKNENTRTVGLASYIQDIIG